MNNKQPAEDEQREATQGEQRQTEQPTQAPSQAPVSEQAPEGRQPAFEDEREITGLENNPSNLMAALSYLGVLVLVPLFMSRDDEFVMYHAKQGLVLLALGVLAVIITQWVFLSVLGSLLFLFVFVASIAGLFQSLTGKRWKIPLVGTIADKFTL